MTKTAFPMMFPGQLLLGVPRMEGKPGLEEVKENECGKSCTKAVALSCCLILYLILFYQVFIYAIRKYRKTTKQQTPRSFWWIFSQIDLHVFPVRSLFVAFYSQSAFMEKTHTPNMIPCVFLWFVGRWLIFVQIESLVVQNMVLNEFKCKKS